MSVEIAPTTESQAPVLDSPEELRTYQMRYEADCVALPYVFRGEGIYLDPLLASSLEGTGRDGDRGTAGIGRATIEIGQVVNGTRDPRSLFDYDKLPKVQVVEDDGWVSEERVLPPTESLHKVAESSSLGKSGKIVAGMLADIVEPYIPTEGDGFIELPMRDDNNVYEAGRYETATGATVKLCSNTEYHFAVHHAGFAEYSGLKELTVSDEVVALKKSSGDHTAILVKPAVLNGVRLPRGSILIPGKDADGNSTFAFGRLSAFVFDSPEEALREMPDVIEKEFVKGEVTGRLELAMDRFNTKYKSGGHRTTEAQLRERLGGTGHVADWKGTLESLLNEIDGELSDPDLQHVTKLLRTIDDTAIRAAHAQISDKRFARENSWKLHQETHQPILERVAQKKVYLNRTFGAARVEEVRKLLDLRELIASRL